MSSDGGLDQYNATQHHEVVKKSRAGDLTIYWQPCKKIG